MMYHRTLLLMVFLACEVNAVSFLINRSDVTQDDQGIPARHVSKRPVEAVGTSENFFSESRAFALVTRGSETTSPTMTRTESNISNKRRSWGMGSTLGRFRQIISSRFRGPNPKAQKKQKHGCCYRCCCCCCRQEQKKKEQQRANQPYNQQTPGRANGSPYPPHRHPPYGHPPNDPRNRNTGYPRYHDTPHRRPPNDPRNDYAEYRRYLERLSPSRRRTHDEYELRRIRRMAAVAKMLNHKHDRRDPHRKRDGRQPHRKHEDQRSDDDRDSIYPAGDSSDIGNMNMPDLDDLSLPNFGLPHVPDFVGNLPDFVGNLPDFGRYRPSVSLPDPPECSCFDEQCCSCCCSVAAGCFEFLGSLCECLFKYFCCCGCPNEGGPLGVCCKCLGYCLLDGSPPQFE